jgi:rhodanese-related sulfurtransferase
MKKVLAILLMTTSSFAFSAEPPKDPSRQTSWGLYLDSKEAHAMKTSAAGSKVLFVDVRDPVEIMFTGFTDVVDINIPFMINNRQNWNPKKNVFAMEVNQQFEPLIAEALKKQQLSKDDPIILMCRSGGERGAPSAKALENKGYKNVYVVVDGFEGDTVKTGDKKNFRLVNGWKNSNLPWGYELNKAKMYQEKSN